MRDKKVLVTCGPTWVSIDDVRVISNRSTGELAHAIVDYLKKEQARVTMLEGPVTHTLKSKGIPIIKFLFFDELATLLKDELKKNYDIIIHATAISDYRPNHAYGAKLSSEFSQLKIALVPTAKLINDIKILSPKSFLVGFKLESSIKREVLFIKANNLMKKAHCDLVVANCSKDRVYEGYIVDKGKKILASAKSRQAIARHLVKVLKERI